MLRCDAERSETDYNDRVDSPSQKEQPTKWIKVLLDSDATGERGRDGTNALAKLKRRRLHGRCMLAGSSINYSRHAD